MQVHANTSSASKGTPKTAEPVVAKLSAPAGSPCSTCTISTDAEFKSGNRVRCPWRTMAEDIDVPKHIGDCGMHSRYR